MSLLPKIFATTCYLLLCVGLWSLKSPRHRAWHPKLMLAGVLGDLGLVLFLEFTRDAIASAAGGQLNAWQYGHIICSLLACVLYVPLLYSGSRLWKKRGDLRLRLWRPRVGIVAFVLRTVGFFLMFSMPNGGTGTAFH